MARRRSNVIRAMVERLDADFKLGFQRQPLSLRSVLHDTAQKCNSVAKRTHKGCRYSNLSTRSAGSGWLGGMNISCVHVFLDCCLKVTSGACMQCVILYTMCNCTQSVYKGGTNIIQLYTKCLILHTVCNFTHNV